MSHSEFLLQGDNLTFEAYYQIVYEHRKVNFPEKIRKRIKIFRENLDKQITEFPEIKIYGVNTGCGDLKDQTVSLQELEAYQIKLIKSHNCGTGKFIGKEKARGMMLLSLNAFAKGHSGVSLATTELLRELLNRDIVPWVLEEGSVGASGDLVPLAMIASVLIGLPGTEVLYQGTRSPAEEVFRKENLSFLQLKPKEALALINGTNFMTAFGLDAYFHLKNLLTLFSLSASLSLEAIRGEKNAFSERLVQARPHKGIKQIAAQIRTFIANSKRMSREAQKVLFPFSRESEAVERVQDRYSFRAIPPVHGAAWEALEKLKNVLEIEMNSATDNPLFFETPKGFQVLSGSNFHGQPLSVIFDYVKIAFTSLGLISDKRTFSLLNKSLNFGLPQNIAVNPNAGDSGLLITQYAGAARAAENRVLSAPASVTSLSTSASQEDFVSMGSIGVLHLHKIIENLYTIVAIEFLVAYYALLVSYKWLPQDLRTLGKITGKVFEFLKENFGEYSEDKIWRYEMEKMRKLATNGKLLKIINEQ